MCKLLRCRSGSCTGAILSIQYKEARGSLAATELSGRGCLSQRRSEGYLQQYIKTVLIPYIRDYINTTEMKLCNIKDEWNAVSFTAHPNKVTTHWLAERSHRKFTDEIRYGLFI